MFFVWEVGWLGLHYRCFFWQPGGVVGFFRGFFFRNHADLGACGVLFFPLLLGRGRVGKEEMRPVGGRIVCLYLADPCLYRLSYCLLSCAISAVLYIPPYIPTLYVLPVLLSQVVYHFTPPPAPILPSISPVCFRVYDGWKVGDGSGLYCIVMTRRIGREGGDGCCSFPCFCFVSF